MYLMPIIIILALSFQLKCVFNTRAKNKSLEYYSPFVYNSVIQTMNQRDIDPVFRFYHNKSRYTDIALTDDGINFLIRQLVNYNRVIFITHGYRGSVNRDWMRELKNEILNNRKDEAVVLVGWGSGSMAGSFPSYSKYLDAVSNTEHVATWLSLYAIKLNKVYPKLKQWAIGHSLGAHLMGQTGRLSKTFARITALDPAGPSFRSGQQNRNKRLRETDAKIVDVIHTCGANVIPIYFRIFDINYEPYGTFTPMGTTDFYPNYGHSQPGCITSYCSHNRAIELFVWSVRNRGKLRTASILASKPDYLRPVNEKVKAKVSAEMGYYFDRNPVKGNYYIYTNNDKPWI